MYPHTEFPPRAFPDTVDAAIRLASAGSLPALGLGLGLGVAFKKVGATYGSFDAAWKAALRSPVGVDAQRLVGFFQSNTGSLMVLLAGVGLLWLVQRWVKRERTFLVDLECFSNVPELSVPYETFERQSRRKKCFSADAMDFQMRMLNKSGVANETMFPPALQTDPPEPSMASAREEAETVLFSCVENLLKKTGMKARDIDVLVVNCSLFNPTPSLSAMIVNRFKMRTNIITYNLAGMGCSAGVISIGLAQQLLHLHPNSTALVVSTENITQNWYFGNEKSMMIPNCLFRVGGAAMVLSNRRFDRIRAKYQLMHVVRTHMGQDDAHYQCVYQQQDHDHNTGVYLSKNLMKIAGHALKANITTLGPLVLPLSEQILFFANLVARKVFKSQAKPYIPDFKLAFEHFCIHTGGRGVIDAIEKQLELTTDMVRPSRETLLRYGNVSSSSIWYVLSNIETKTGIKRGERVWQIAFGSGFKCNSAVWKCVNERLCNERHPCWLEASGEEAVCGD